MNFFYREIHSMFVLAECCLTEFTEDFLLQFKKPVCFRIKTVFINYCL